MKYLQVILINCLIFLTIGCNGFVKTGVPQASATMNVSKMKGAFICQYIPDNKIIEIGTDRYRIEEAWIEYRWSYLNSEDIEIEKDFRNFYIKALNLTTKENDFEFSAEDDFFSRFEVLNPNFPENKYLGYSGGKLDMRLEKNQSIPEKIEIEFKGNIKTDTIVFTKLK